MGGSVKNAEKLVELAMKGNDASHDAAHAFRVRDLALSLAHEEGLSSSPEAMEIVSENSHLPYLTSSLITYFFLSLFYPICVLCALIYALQHKKSKRRVWQPHVM